MNLMSIWKIQIWMLKETKKPPSVFKFSFILPWIFTICSTWTLPMFVSSFVFVIDLKVPFGSQRNLFGFIVQHLKLMLILPPIPWNKAKLLNAPWKWLWVTLIIKIAFLGATWYKRCLLEMVLLVRAGWGWAWKQNPCGSAVRSWAQGWHKGLGWCQAESLSSATQALGLQGCTLLCPWFCWTAQKWIKSITLNRVIEVLVCVSFNILLCSTGKNGNEKKLMMMRGKEK